MVQIHAPLLRARPSRLFVTAFRLSAVVPYGAAYPIGAMMSCEKTNTKEDIMSNETDWDELSDEYTEHTPAIIGETIRPQRAITMDDIDDIFAGRPLADQPRRKADVLYKAYLTPDMDAQVRAQAEREHIGKSALIRKALAAYLTANQAQPAMA